MPAGMVAFCFRSISGWTRQVSGGFSGRDGAICAKGMPHRYLPHPSFASLALLALLLLRLSSVAAAAPVAVVQETFSDANRSGQGRTLPLTTLDWHLGPMNTPNSIGPGGWNVSPKANTMVVAHFNPVTLPVGASLSVSFSYRHSGSPALAPFRIGLLDSAGSRLTGDVGGVAPGEFSAYGGYLVFTAVGGSSGGSEYTVRKNVTDAANLFGLAENRLLVGSVNQGPGATVAGTSYTGSITLAREDAGLMRVDSIFNDVANGGTDPAPVTTFDTLAVFITAEVGTFEIGNVVVTTTGNVGPAIAGPVVTGPRVLEIDRRGGAAYTSIAKAVATGLKPGDTLRLAPGSGPYRELVDLSASGTAAAPIVLDAGGETVTGFDVLEGFQTVGGVATCDLTRFWTGSVAPQGFTKVDGRWRAIAATGSAAQPLPFVLTYKGERLVQSSAIRTTPPPGSPAGTLGKLGQLTRHAVLSDDGNTLTLLPGTSAGDWEISVRNFAVRIYNASHQTYRNLKVSGSLNDGVNLHGDGTGLLFENLEGFNNLDEGFSAHDTIACEIRGGVFHRNDNGLYNVNAAVMVANDIACYDNLGHGFALAGTTITEVNNLRSFRNGVSGLVVYNQSALTLSAGEIAGGGWTGKPYLSCNESGAVFAYRHLEVATATGALIQGEVPVILDAAPPLSLGLDFSGRNLVAVYHCPAAHQNQLQASSDLLAWESAGPALSDDITHQWTEALVERRFYRLLRW